MRRRWREVVEGVATLPHESLVQTHREGEVCTIMLNRPNSANALSMALLNRFVEVLEELRTSEVIRVVVVTGAGRKAFCAGADLKERQGMAELEVKNAVGLIRHSITLVSQLPMPVIASINGAAFGGGTELALAADLRIAARSARMGLTETSLAIIPGAGGTQRLPRLIGVARAKELIYMSRRITAEEAFSIGLVNAVVDDDDLEATTKAWSIEIARNGPIAVRQAKLAINLGMEVDLQTGLRIEEQSYERIIRTADRVEGLRAFAEKRPPKYEGR